jgi:uncharacterized protein (TIGR02271 family)
LDERSRFGLSHYEEDLLSSLGNPQDLYGAEVSTVDGGKLGKIEDIYSDNATGRPEWAEVKTGLFGSKMSLIPLAAAERVNGGLQVPFDKDRVKSAPSHERGQALSTDEEARLFEHYGIPYGGETVTAESGQPGPTGGERMAAGDQAMTRSEEELTAAKVRQEAGRVRLRKWVETEPVQFEVPVEREQAHIEREPITEANREAAMSGPELSEAVHEETLYEEHVEPVKQVVPKERVRIQKDSEIGEEHVSDEVAKERVDVERDV